ncbi:hypothetical protein SAMN05660686_04864 [Thalassobaculum litoreum DSM 18839]|uniref:Uncharacterized protein n=1 Tax=Thalassobaculum litoreum DSM 18839 TaxID=1123362 RepID=A0A8G2EYH4_9PROT|nr:hypothetical protein SAMN05660686_04864 [Thalassobaculum litoreum DSM 18839]
MAASDWMVDSMTNSRSMLLSALRKCVPSDMTETAILALVLPDVTTG